MSPVVGDVICSIICHFKANDEKQQFISKELATARNYRTFMTNMFSLMCHLPRHTLPLSGSNPALHVQLPIGTIHSPSPLQ